MPKTKKPNVDQMRKPKTVKCKADLYDRFAYAAMRKFGRNARLPGAITLGVEEALTDWLEANP